MTSLLTKHFENGNTLVPIIPFLIFQGAEARIADRVEGTTIYVTDPDEGVSLIHQVDSSILRSNEMTLTPKATPLERIGKLPVVTHQETIFDPLYSRLPYILKTYQLLEACTRKPAYRVALEKMQEITSYELRYNLNLHMPEFSNNLPICISCHVFFTPTYCLFTTPKTQVYKALLQNNK